MPSRTSWETGDPMSFDAMDSSPFDLLKSVPQVGEKLTEDRYEPGAGVVLPGFCSNGSR